MIRTMQELLATREDITAFIKKVKTKKTSPKLNVCKNFDKTYKKPTLPDDAPQAVVLFAGGGGIEAGMVQAGIPSSHCGGVRPHQTRLEQGDTLRCAVRRKQGI
ncbi:hypothetical protein LC608_35360 [Nostoc sp. XA010]|uniref:hypothetical protein n=1 Tax=Nostoc sp. XA010 TaxID=2780407 RepID=UPI001E5C9B4C|nr:hypothetical protein [Nostoc sp. XA010]MCC5662097.1 hypothetical protein [Nostoc sp. XA010]